MRTLAPLALLFLSTQAAASFSWGSSITASSGRILHPAVLVGFNPQPDPPVGYHRATSGARLVGLEMSGPGGTDAELLVGLGLDELDIERIVLPGSACGSRVDTQVYPLGEDDEVRLPGRCGTGDITLLATLSDGTELEVQVDISAAGREDPASIVGFNPQPDPPGVTAFGLAVSFARAPAQIDVDVAMIDPTTGEAVVLQ